jgi:hypothetical protein
MIQLTGDRSCRFDQGGRDVEEALATGDGVGGITVVEVLDAETPSRRRPSSN